MDFTFRNGYFVDWIGLFRFIFDITTCCLCDARYDQFPVFELNNETNYFEMLIDKEMKYEKEVVEEDDDFLIFEIEKDIATLIE